MVAAPILTPPSANLDLPPETQERFRAHWAGWWVPLRDQIRLTPPVENSAEELATLKQFLEGLGQTMGEFGPEIVPLLRRGFDRLLQDLVSAEDAVAAAERRLGMRFLSRAVQVLDTFFEAFRAFGTQFPDALLRVSDPAEGLAEVIDPASMALLRLELAVFVAFDLTETGTPGEFVEWARRAQNASNHASPYVPFLFREKSFVGAGTVSPDVALSGPAFDRVVDLLDDPPAPSARLRGLIRGRDS